MSTDEILVRPEATGVRVLCGRAEYLFRHVTAEALRDHAEVAVAAAREHFARRRRGGGSGRTLTDPEFHSLTAELAVHWLYFHIMNHRPPAVRDADWEHPQSRRIIRAHADRVFGPGSSAAHRVAADLCGLTVASYLEWMETDRGISEMF